LFMEERNNAGGGAKVKKAERKTEMSGLKGPKRGIGTSCKDRIDLGLLKQKLGNIKEQTIFENEGLLFQ